MGSNVLSFRRLRLSVCFEADFDFRLALINENRWGELEIKVNLFSQIITLKPVNHIFPNLITHANTIKGLGLAFQRCFESHISPNNSFVCEGWKLMGFQGERHISPPSDLVLPLQENIQITL